MKINLFLLRVLVGAFLCSSGLLVGPAHAMRFDGFSPSGGWAGEPGNPRSGTIVRIVGDEFDPNPRNNVVTFSDASGGSIPGVRATTLASYPEGSQYEIGIYIGAPGSALGELKNPMDVAVDVNTGNIFVVNQQNFRIEVFDQEGTPLRHIGASTLGIPWGVALGPDGNVYVSDVASSEGDRIAVFSQTGAFLRSIGVGILEFPQDLVVGGDGSVYCIDGGIGIERLNKLTNDGTRMFADTGPVDNPFHSLIGIAIEDPSSTTDTRIYLTDYLTRTIYIYNSSGEYIDQWHITDDLGYPSYVTPGHIAVDWEGFVYVQLGDTVAKINPAGTLAQEVIDITLLPTANFATVDINKIIYSVDNNPSSQFVKTFVPIDTEELLVYVPAGAMTGNISVTRLDSSGDETVSSRDVFTVFTETTPLTIEAIEITQGMATYSLVAGKDTLVWADIDGLFGDPTRDRAILSITNPNGIVTNLDATHYVYDFNIRNSRTKVHFHIPNRYIDGAGNYRFEVVFQRDGVNIDTPWVQELGFDGTKAVELVLAKFTDVSNDQWDTEPPFDWFNMRDFLHGISTFNRTFPVNPHEVSIHFVEERYLDCLVDGVQYTSMGGGFSDIDRLVAATRQAFNTYESDCDDCVQLCIGTFDLGLMPGGSSGWVGFAPLNQSLAVVPFNDAIVEDGELINTWGGTLVHELGHSLGLVPEGNANHDPGDPNYHSINGNLDAEDGLPFSIWNSLIDRFIPAGTAASAMFYSSGGRNDLYFFENRYAGEDVDYPFLIGKFRNEAHSASRTIALTDTTTSDPKIVIVGGIKEGNIVIVQESYVTSAGVPLTPVEPSDYSLVFLNSADDVLAQDKFAAAFKLMDAPETQTEMFNLVRPLPTGAVKIEIRYREDVLTTIAASAHAPTVNNVHVDLSVSLPIIGWEAEDADGDFLSFTLMYSPDGGANYQPIATGLTESPFVWDHHLTGGSTEALVKVFANDGFFRAQAESSRFSLPKKAPIIAILRPDMNTVFTEGAPINLRGVAFDPEEGLLPDASLKWQMDEIVNFGSGQAVSAQYITRSIPTGGGVATPIAVGLHTFQLMATDGEGNTSSAEAMIEIVADRDRDGFSDSDELAAGSDPADPFIRPQRKPVADPNGPYSGAEGQLILFDGSGSSDPDGDSLAYFWQFGDGADGSGRVVRHAYADDMDFAVSLTVTDSEGLSDIKSTIAAITNIAPTVTMDPLTQPNPQFILPLIHELTFAAQFSDPGWLDTHSALWDFGDGATQAGTLNEENFAPDATGVARATHTYTAPGHYSVTITITDDDGAFGSSTLSLTVVDEFGALQDFGRYIEGLPETVFKHPAEQRKKALKQKIQAVNQMLVVNNYAGAIQKLSKDLGGKMDEESAMNDWITDMGIKTELLRKIQDLILYLKAQM